MLKTQHLRVQRGMGPPPCFCPRSLRLTSYGGLLLDFHTHSQMFAALFVYAASELDKWSFAAIRNPERSQMLAFMSATVSLVISSESQPVRSQAFQMSRHGNIPLRHIRQRPEPHYSRRAVFQSTVGIDNERLGADQPGAFFRDTSASSEVSVQTQPSGGVVICR